MGTNLPDFFLLSRSVAVDGKGRMKGSSGTGDTLRAAGPMEIGLQVLL